MADTPWQNDYSPFSHAKLKNPATGRFLSNLEANAERAEYAASAYGRSDEDQQLLQTITDIEHDSPAVKAYLGRMLEAIRTTSDNPRALKALIPDIRELMRTARMDDITLKDTEKTRIDRYGTQLIQFINQKTAIFTRLRQRAANVIRDKDYRQKLADAYQDNHGPLGALISAVIRPRAAKSDPRAEARAARAEALRAVADHAAATPLDDGPLQRAPNPADVEVVKPTRGKKGAATGSDNDDKLNAILSTDQAILKELQDQTVLLRQELEDEVQDDEAAERQSIEKTDAKAVTETGKIVKDGTGAQSSRSLVDRFNQIVAKAAEHAKLFGEGALIAAAGWAGWKVGSWVAQLTGLGNSSDALAQLMDTSKQSLASTFESIITTGENLLTTGHTAAQNEAAGAQQDTIDRALKAGMQSRHAYQNKFTAEMGADAKRDLYKDAVTFLDQHRIGAPSRVTPLDSNALPNLGSLAPNLAVAPTVEKAPATRLPQPPPVAPKVQRAANQPTKMSPEGLQTLKHGRQGSGYGGEGFLAVAKPDRDTGWAIGYGMHEWQGKPVSPTWPDHKITEAEADAEMNRQLEQRIYPEIRRDISVPLTQGQFDSLVSFAWNNQRGWKNMARHVNEGTATPEYFLKSATSHGQFLPALAARRRVEAEPFAAPTRASTPVHTLSTTVSDQRTAPPVIVAPTTNVSQGGGGVLPMMPQPVQARNPDDVIKAITGANNF